MLWRDTVNLLAVTLTENSIGDTVESTSSRTVYANKKSIRQSEFYQAMAHNLKPELMFEVKSIDYQGEVKLVYNSKTYQIIRTYDKNGETTELVCTGLVVG